jgi:hypothetical protein
VADRLTFVRGTRLGLALVLASLVLWSLIPALSNVDHRDYSTLAGWGGFVCFVAGWFVVGAGLRPRGSTLLGAMAAASAYIALGVVWVVLWNTTLRVRDHFILPEVSGPVMVLATVLTWPGQAVTFLLDPFY